jgi:DNA-binding response OmpR family regulator
VQPPDIVLLGAEWQARALLRAQLIEQGFEVIAVDTWPLMRRHLGPGLKPRLAIVDLQGLHQPEQILDELRILMDHRAVLVLSGIGTVAPARIEDLGFQVLNRPVTIGSVVAEAERAIRQSRPQTNSSA